MPNKTPIQSKFIEIILRHDCSPVNLLHIFRTPFPKKSLWRAVSENVRNIFNLGEVFPHYFKLETEMT